MPNIKKKVSLSTSIALLVVSLLTIGFAFKQQYDLGSQQKEQEKQIKNVVKSLIKETQTLSKFPDYDSLKNLKKVELVSNFVTWTPSSNLTQDMIKKNLVLDKGELAKSYIYIRASIDNGPLTQWESIYMTMNGVGGHLFRPLSLPIPSSNKTELLYAINNVPYLTDIPYNEQSSPVTANWFSFFTDGSVIETDSFISSLRPALLEEVSIYYQCIKNSDCLLTVK